MKLGRFPAAAPTPTGRRRPGLPVAMLAAVVGCSVIPGAASAKVMSYRDRSVYHDEVRAGVAAWNDVGLRLRLVRAEKGRHADITFENHDFGHAWTVGQAGGPVVWLQSGSVKFGGNPLLRQMGFVVTHELGHELGLGHVGSLNACSVMIPFGDHVPSPACHLAADRQACGPQRRDALAAGRIWGFRPGAKARVMKRSFGTCGAADGPGGAPLTASMCLPKRVPLDTGDAPPDSAIFSHAAGAYHGQQACYWRSERTGKTIWQLVVGNATWSRDPEKYPVDGDCDGMRDLATMLYNTPADQVAFSTTRFVTLRILNKADTDAPVGGWTTVLTPTLAATENGQVGLQCGSEQG